MKTGKHTHTQNLGTFVNCIQKLNRLVPQTINTLYFIAKGLGYLTTIFAVDRLVIVTNYHNQTKNDEKSSFLHI